MSKTVIISELAAGGVERVNYLLAKGLSERNTVKTISIKGLGKEIIQDIDSVCLNKDSGKKAFFDLLRVLQKEKPAWIITCDHTSTLCALIYRRWVNRTAKCMLVVHSVYTSMFRYKKKRQLILQHYLPKALRLYNRCDAVIYVSKGVKADFESLYRIDSQRGHVIYNPVFTEMPCKQRHAQFYSSPLRIVTAGRLAIEKRQNLLISTIQKLKDLRIGAELYIYGEGPLKQSLQEQAAQMGVKERVHFCGFHKNLIEELAQYDLFCLTSEYESFGNVLVEAMGARVPVLAVDCPFGPREILEGGACGCLVEASVDAIVNEILRLIAREVDHDMIDRAYHRAEEFRLMNVVNRYEEVMTGGEGKI